MNELIVAEERHCTSRALKPALPPKPRFLGKPNVPPKPPNLCTIARVTVYKATLSQDSKNNTFEQTPSCDVGTEILSVTRQTHEKFDHLNSDVNDTQNTTCRDNDKTRLIHNPLCRQSDIQAVPLSPIFTNGAVPGSRGWNVRCNGNPPSICSTDSSTSSDAPQDCLLEDNLGKLSDADDSSRSSSSSPIPKCGSSLSALGSFSSTPTFSSKHLDVTTSDTNSVLLTDIAYKDSCDISDREKRKVYNIVNEMMTSEEVFCNVLKLLNVTFRNFIIDRCYVISGTNNSNNNRSASRCSSQITEEELNRILNYLPQLQNFSEGFLADLKQRLTDWDQHYKIADIIVTKGPFLKMYSCYIRDFEHQCTLLDEACSKYPSFARELQSFEASDICCKLSLKHYMLKPVQRIPQYRLLFESYIKLLPSSSPDIDDSKRALAILEDVANHANDTIKIEDKVSALLSLQRRMYRGQDGAEPELIKPGRELLKQGELMKLSRRGMQPRYFVLLSDGLLYTSLSSSNGLLRLNTELPLEGMRVSKPLADDFKAELTIRATQRSFTLQARSESERDEWLSAIQAAIDANIVRRSTFLAARTAAYVAPTDYELGKQAPVWVPDYRVTMCQLCTAEFSLTFRRHHCRACGKVVCVLCSSNRAPLAYKKNCPERVCDQCYEALYCALQTQLQQRKSIIDEASTDVVAQDCEELDAGTTDKEYFKRELTLTDLKKLEQNFKKGVRDSMRGKCYRRPERLLEVCGNDTGSQMRGYLRRQGLGRRGWFVLKERVLYQYAAPEDVCALESLPVLGYKLDTKGMSGAEPSFTLKHPNQDDITFIAETADLALKWVAVMREATVLQ